MDIAGAKALRDRLGNNATEEAPPFRADVDVADDAPPVYHWVGVSQQAYARPAIDAEPAVPSDSLFRRLGLSLR